MIQETNRRADGTVHNHTTQWHTYTDIVSIVNVTTWNWIFSQRTIDYRLAVTRKLILLCGNLLLHLLSACSHVRLERKGSQNSHNIHAKSRQHPPRTDSLFPVNLVVRISRFFHTSINAFSNQFFVRVRYNRVQLAPCMRSYCSTGIPIYILLISMKQLYTCWSSCAYVHFVFYH